MGVALFSLTSLIGGLAQAGGELIGALVLIVARVAVAESRAEGERPTLDWAGALTVTGGLVALVYGIVSTDSHSWARHSSWAVCSSAPRLSWRSAGRRAGTDTPWFRYGCSGPGRSLGRT
jgi:hypothetical protein